MNEYPTVEEISNWLLIEAEKGGADPLVKDYLIKLTKSAGMQQFSRLVEDLILISESLGETPLQFGMSQLAFGILIGLQVQKSKQEVSECLN